MNLDVIEEELVVEVEEGCDNELEASRATMQMIRRKTQTWNDNGAVEGTYGEEEDATEMHLSGLQ